MIEARRFLGRLPPRAWAMMLLGAIAIAGILQVAPIDPDLPSKDLYIVDVDPDSPFAAAADDPRIRTTGPPDAVLGDAVHIDPGPRGDSVHVILHNTYLDHVDDVLSQEPDQAAAFPLTIDAHYVTRDTSAAAVPGAGDGDGGGSSGSSDAGDDGGEGAGGGGTSGDGPTTTADTQPDPERTADSQTAVRPRELDPPFPIRSLLLTFAYVVPAALIMQLHGANLHAERTKGRARVLLSTPMGPARLLWQKAAPFATLLLILDVAVTLTLGAGWAAFVAAGVVMLLLLALTTFMALWARNPRELGMLNVGATTMLNVFLFLPAMFPSIPPVAYLSPIHVVAQSMAGAAIPAAAFLYAVVPSLLASIALAAVAVAFTTEELWLGDGFRIPRAVRRASPGWRTLPAGVLVVPFVFVLQLTVLVTLTVLGLDVALWFALPASVLIEEVAKSLVARGRTWILGGLVGVGFFIGEKTALLLTLVGFQDLPYGEQALALLGSGTGFLLLAAPLALHVATGILLTRSKWGFFAAIAVHFGYDRLILGVAG